VHRGASDGTQVFSTAVLAAMRAAATQVQIAASRQIVNHQMKLVKQQQQHQSACHGV
jgi:hypothetical protein